MQNIILSKIFSYAPLNKYAYATYILPSNAQTVRGLLNAAFSLLILPIGFLLILNIIKFLIRFLNRKSTGKAKNLTSRYLVLLGLIVSLKMIVNIAYCPVLTTILGPENNFFRVPVASCNSWMGCPTKPLYSCE